MHTYNDWHLWRELVLLSMLGLFVLAALATGMLENRRKSKRHAAALTGQDTRVSTKTRTPSRDGTGRSAQQRTWLEEQPVATHTMHAA